MGIALTTETQQMIEERMKLGGYASPDDLIRAALSIMDSTGESYVEDLDADIQSALAEAEEQSARGEGRPWADVRAELLAKYVRG